MRISQLETIVRNGGRVALWGWGRECRAAWRALRARESGIRIPESGTAKAAMPLTLFCTQAEAVEAQALDDAMLRVETEATSERLSAFDIVIKSPGISAYRPELLAAAEHGTRFIGGTALWFAEHPDARTICVTGTKGKSTTTALLAHLLRAGGHGTALAGNIGLPLLELIDGEAEFWVIELSSYQTRDVAASGVRPEVAVVLNIFPEHLDWHGSEQRYVEDKLSLLTEAQPRIAVLNASDPTLASFVGAPHGRDQVLRLADFAPTLSDGMGRSYSGDVCCFGRADGWHLRGDTLYRGDLAVMDTTTLPLPGHHNRGNLCAALTAIDALGLDALVLAPHAATFAPLPHRLQVLGTRDGITWVNDSISTTPHASLAALEVYRDQRGALLVGGHDRGLDWRAFADAMRGQAPVAIITMGQNGARIYALLTELAKSEGFELEPASDLADAVTKARQLLGAQGGVVLLSPGAPSFGPYHDYTERGRHFATLAGFDGAAINTIQGLGIA